MKFREHRGLLDESMETLVELENHDALVKHCQALLAKFDFRFKPEDLRVEPYFMKLDDRIGWEETHIITIDKYGVMGFTDSTC